ncbi:uncharacterized protein BXZ73DRAFT_107111 [Epithele typhae]|uniref:uncharacterized protein n=1 Tax=Epithele typhae TaxID=378194 RepID=UPI002007BC7B|nr:uncharacterized protein BXZ73DRAFT_107111 [Epithele typhae]KAH9912967.1 hypothetical protein BXZ73DRAFT_107111 [Epithele typhae]
MPLEMPNDAQGRLAATLEKASTDFVDEKASIHTLPLEVLHDVFSYIRTTSQVTPSHLHTSHLVRPTKAAHTPWIVLLAVCSRWRNFICSTAEYWRCIHLYSPRPDWLKLCLSRAKLAGPCLDVYFHGINVHWSLLGVLLENSQHIRTLSHDEMGDGWPDALREFLSSDPLLRVLSISGRKPRLSFDVSSCANLRSLVLHNVVPVMGLSLYTQLEHLELSVAPWMSDWSHLHKALSACTKLVTLSLRSCLSHLVTTFPPSIQPTISLPRLRSLHLEHPAGNTHQWLLSFIHLPRIKHVHITENLTRANRAGISCSFSSILPTAPIQQSLSAIFPFVRDAVAIELSTLNPSFYTFKSFLCAPNDTTTDHPCALVLTLKRELEFHGFDRRLPALPTSARCLHDVAYMLPGANITTAHLSVALEDTTSADFAGFLRSFPHLLELRLAGEGSFRPALEALMSSQAHDDARTTPFCPKLRHLVLGAPCKFTPGLLITLGNVLRWRKGRGAPLHAVKLNLTLAHKPAFQSVQEQFAPSLEAEVLGSVAWVFVVDFDGLPRPRDRVWGML